MSDLKPIAEAGPAPTTAAPAELPNRREFHASPPAEFAAAAKVAQGGDTIIVPDWPLPREAAPAEQPGKADEGDHADDCTDPNCHKRHTIPAGKAADPRPAHPTLPSCDAPEGMAWVCPECQSWATLRENAHAHQIKTGHRPPSMKSRPRPAQPQAPARDETKCKCGCPKWMHDGNGRCAGFAYGDGNSAECGCGNFEPQAPAEPSEEQIEKARKLAMKIFAFHNSGNADLGKETAWIEAYADHVAAPLREERDRLAGRLKALESRWKDASEQINAAKYMVEKARDCERAEKAVAARDARIATLENELRGVLRHVEREAEEHAQAAIKIRAALGAPEGQPRDYDPMTSPVPEGDMNGPHGPIPAPEGQPPVAPSEAPLRLEVRRLAEAFGKAGSEYERGGNTSGAAQLRRVSNLLYALWADGKAEVFTPFTCAEPEAPLDALREAREFLIDLRRELLRTAPRTPADSLSDLPESLRRASTLARCSAAIRALSAPPPPTREKQELLGEKGAKPDGLLRAMAYARDELDGCAHGDGCCRDCLARILASMDETISLARSAPPRKAPQEKTQNAIRQALRDLREVQEHAPPDEETGTALNAVEHRLLTLLPAGEPWPIPAPSPEEQLSEGETTKKEG